MASQEVVPVPGGPQDKGINTFEPDIAGEITWDESTFNVAGGSRRGVGPRPGMAPLPGHSDAERPGAATDTVGLMGSESSNTHASPTTRVKFYGVIPMRLRGPRPANIGTVSDYYFWAVTVDSSAASSERIFDLLPNSTVVASSMYAHASSFAGGLQFNSHRQNNVGLLMELIPAGTTTTKLVNLNSILAMTNNYVSMAAFSVPGPQVPMQWLLGDAVATGDVNHAPSLVFYSSTATTSTVAKGVPPEMQTASWTKVKRDVKVYALTVGFNMNIDYQVSFEPTTSIYRQRNEYNDDSAAQVDFSATVATKVTAGTSYASTIAALMHDVESRCDSSYKAVLAAAGGKPIACIIQDWSRDSRGSLNQWADLTELPTRASSGTQDTVYQEGGTRKKSCFRSWPAFIRGTAMVTDAATGLGLGAANTGLLRANQVYEFTYSIYNKRLNFETNVGEPVKFQTGVADFVSLIVFNATTTGANATAAAEAITDGNWNVPWPGSDGGNVSANVDDQYLHVNYLEYRFYYRVEGMTEWLPALFIDVAKFWFFPYNIALSACTGGIGGLPGGRPGGFVDYSMLPNDKYTCVVQYRGRAFWFSEKSIYFSLQNNLFAYPGRNSIAAPDGSFRGGTFHTFKGQVEERGRLVVWGSNGAYLGRFTGHPQVVPVQISTTEVAEFPLDGTDFVLEPWTTVTAFSHRAAAVAEGVLYWWGPDGIRSDNGTEDPDNIGIVIEPNLHTLYDPSATDEIHAIYDSQARQVIWFYTPKTADGYATHSVAYNVETGKFTFEKFVGKIDSAQTIDIKTNLPTAGKRVIVSERATGATTVQRGYFFDSRCKAGDIRPTTEMMVESFSTPTTGRRRLQLADGFDSTNFNTIVAGDIIALSHVSDYASTLTLQPNFLATVAGTNLGSKYIDIILPDGVTFDASGSLDRTTYFPIWHKAAAGVGLNGITYQLVSNYWLAGALRDSWHWLYLQLLFKYVPLKAPTGAQLTLAYRMLRAQGYVSDTITLSDNSDGHYQLLQPLADGLSSQVGQALKYKISGIHIGNPWTLEYLEAHVLPEDGFSVKEFQG